MAKTTVYITRHGQTQWNVEGRMQGRLDSPLTELGVRQATWLRDSLIDVNFAAIYASSSPRARRTAEILRHQRTSEVIEHDDLQEIFLGDWEGQLDAAIEQNYAAAHTAFWETPHLYAPNNGGESYFDVQKRVLPLLASLLEKHEGETILISTHTVIVKLMMCQFENRPLARLWRPPFIHPTSLCKIVVENGQTRIELHGDISHFQEAKK